MEGDNLIGRRSKGTEVDIPIETSDPSMDRRHCIINVKRNKQGEVIYTLRDNDSITGTFLMNEILGNKDGMKRQHRIWQRSWHDVLRISNFLKSRRQNNIHLQMAAEREDLSAIITMPCYPACKE